MPSLRTIIGWAILIVLVWSFIQAPQAWAHGVTSALGLLKQGGASLATFFSSL
jgi:hypothetical protein